MKEGEKLKQKLKKITLLTAMMVLSAILVACGGNKSEKETATTNGEIKVVTSFTILTDMVEAIGGENVAVHNLVPTGTDPHEYEPLPEDIKAATDADVLFYNGLNLEGGKNGWFGKMMDATGQDWDNAYELTEGVEPEYVVSGDGRDEEINPHAFLDPHVGIKMAENTIDALIEIDPDNEDYYKENGEAYVAQLQEIADEYEEKLGEIPEENRVLVTSEQAYQYMTKRYGLEEGFIWAIDTEENGSPEQIKSLLAFIKEHEPPVLFVETNVDTRPMETVAAESGVEIFGELYSDEIGEKGSEVDTYVKFLQYNIDMLHEGLIGE